jgi:hypothetical protein
MTDTLSDPAAFLRTLREEAPLDASALAVGRRFIDVNREALVDYWKHAISTDELRKRLRPI